MIQKISSDDVSPGLDRPYRPYHRPNDPWVEVPSDPVNVAAAEIRRAPSLRTRRRNFTAACTAFTLGAIFIICSSPFAKEFFVPGPLSSHHAPLVAAQGADRCAACHANANGSLVGWIANSFGSGHRTELTQSELCMKCHEQSLADGFALNPHNVDPRELQALTGEKNQVLFDAGMIFHPPVNEQQQIACSVCHREHHGEQDMKQLTDAQCQTCHSKTFHSFETDHAEFVNYSNPRRSRLAFDHSKHAGQHFPGRQKAFQCSQCHLDDAFQNVKELAPYEQSCAECHHQQIINSSQQGLAILALPMIDTNAIEAANLTAGSWPLAATGDFDGNIPALMRVLLAADSKAREIFQKVGPDFEFSDVDPTNQESVQDAVELVWAIKRLFYDLSLNGPQAVRDRLEQVLGFEISDQRLQQMISTLDEPVFQNAVKRWLPELPQEVAANHGGQRQRIAESPPVELQKSGFASRPIEADTRLNRVDQPPMKQVSFPIVRLPGNRTEASDDQQQKWSDNVFADPNHDPQLLAINPLKAIFAELKNDQAPDQTVTLPNIIVPAPPVAGLIGEQSPQVNAAESQTKDGPNASGNSNSMRPLVMPSGWFRNDQLFRISYRPSGHADPCIQNWIELVTQATDADTRVETKQLFEKTISMTGVGLCRTCHTLDQLPDRSFMVNWRAEYRNPSVRSFTRFAHGPHTLQPTLQDCSHCHRLDLQAGNAESFLLVDATRSVSNFKPMTKSDCASCHQKGRTGNGCTQCHNYHVGSRVMGQK